MQKTVEGVLRQYGTTMTVTNGEGSCQVKGFFQPVRSKSWQSLTRESTPLGEAPQGQYVYIGPAATAVAEGDSLSVLGKAYLFRRVEPYCYGDETVYLWGLCVEKGVADTWGSQF